MSFVLLYGATLFAIFIVQCSPDPINTLWLDPEKCHRSSLTELTGPPLGSFLNAFLDGCILVLPIRMVCMLQMTTKRKTMVCALFALGSL